MNDYDRIPSPICCCCCSIRRGVFILGLIELVFVGLSIAERVYFLIEPTESVKLFENGQPIADPIPNKDLKDVDRYMAYAQLALNGAQTLVIFMLLYGVAAVVPCLVLPHLIIQWINNLFLAAQATIVCLSYGVRPYTIGQAVIWGIIIFIVFYFTYVVWRCYKYLKALKAIDHMPNGFVVREMSSEMTSL